MTMKSLPYRALVCLSSLSCLFALAACHEAAQNVPGDSDDHRPWQGIAESEEVHFLGTEPFWGGKVSGTELTYSTPENQDGETITVSRFAGRGGLSFSGSLSEGVMTMAVTPAQCSDGMSDRSYPFAVTLQVGADARQGCAWTDRQPYRGGEQAG